MPVKSEVDGELVVLTPTRQGDTNPDRVIIMAREEIRRLIGEQIRKIIVDCSDLDFLSSTEVGAMIGAMREINQVQGAIVFTGIGVRLAEIFEVMRILEVLPIRLTTREAQLELGKIRGKEPNLLARLTGANPTLSQIHAWSDGRMGIGPTPRNPTPKPDTAAPRPEDEETLFGGKAARVVQELQTGQTTPDVVDPWNLALQIIRMAQNLCEEQGVDFKPTMSFQEFLGHLSMKLPPR